MSNILHSQAPDGVLAHVSQNLKRFRGKAGLSQAALADASGISRRMIVAVEGGDANISLSSLDKLAMAMGVGFVDLVRAPLAAPDYEAAAIINETAWRGRDPRSNAALLASAPATAEAQLWSWRLAPGERYDAEPDPDGWHEMIFVTDGELTLTLSDTQTLYKTGDCAVFSSAQSYAYENRGKDMLTFLRNVVS